jgi:hypothetical protein
MYEKTDSCSDNSGDVQNQCEKETLYLFEGREFYT